MAIFNSYVSLPGLMFYSMFYSTGTYHSIGCETAVPQVHQIRRYTVCGVEPRITKNFYPQFGEGIDYCWGFTGFTA